MEAHVATAQAQSEAVRVARAILSGDIGVLDGCIPLAALAHKVVSDWRVDPDFVVFGGIASEADALPLGKVRAQWSSAALAKADVEIARYTQLVKEQVLSACRNVVERFEAPRAAVPSNTSLERTRER
jgi:hypothetical protein